MYLVLPHFEAPLELLLYLIKSQEVNIFNIPIIDITQQYMQYINNINTLDFDKAGEYLAMAAQLIQIKAASLIPHLQPLSSEAQSLDDIPDTDPRKPLVEKLLEFQAIQEAALQLAQIPQAGKDFFTSGEYQRRKEEFENLSRPLKGDPYSLGIALEKVLLRFAARQSAPKVKVRAQKITIQAKMLELKEIFFHRAQIAFSELLIVCRERYELIVTFMALLELCKANEILLVQDTLFADIYIMVPPPTQNCAVVATKDVL